MMPMSEFHFAFCGIATVAATLGYACARRAVRSLSVSPTESPKADVEAGPQEERSLKRKLVDAEEHDVDAEEQSRPMKRNRTPPTDRREPDEDFNQEWEVIVAPPPYEEVVGLRQMEKPVQVHSTPFQCKDPLGIEQNVTPVREPTPQADLDASSQKEKGAEAGRCSTPPPPTSEPEIPPPPPCPMTPPKASVPAKTKPINAFSGFSGSSSPFGSYTNASGTSPFVLPGQSTKATPAWRRNNEAESGVFGQACSNNTLVSSPNDVLTSATTQSPAPSQAKDALGVSSETQPPVKASSCLTGEEGETVEAELKGVKLFVKRGRKEFTDGIYGHVKILTRKSEEPQDIEAQTDSRTRLLFRRDPLGQVSMNAGLSPAVRCHYDSAENILRVILMEAVTTDEQNPKEDVVVYALKPGRAQRADFQSFAKVLCDHEELKSRLAAGRIKVFLGLATLLANQERDAGRSDDVSGCGELDVTQANAFTSWSSPTWGGGVFAAG